MAHPSINPKQVLSDPKQRGPSVTGVFRTRQAAEDAVQVALDHGYHREDLTLIAAGQSGEKLFPQQAEAQRRAVIRQGAVVGGATGIFIGLFAGVILAVASGDVVVINPLISIPVGVVAFGFLGALVGSWVGRGVPPEPTTEYDELVQQGGMAITLHPHDEADGQAIREAWNHIRAQQ